MPPREQRKLLPLVQRLKAKCSDDEVQASKELKLRFKPTDDKQSVYAQMCQMEGHMVAVQTGADSFVLALVVDAGTETSELITIRPTAEKLTA